MSRHLTLSNLVTCHSYLSVLNLKLGSSLDEQLAGCEVASKSGGDEWCPALVLRVREVEAQPVRDVVGD